MPVRLLTDVKQDGQVIARRGDEVDLDALGLDQKSFIAEGLAEVVNQPGVDAHGVDLGARVAVLEQENADLRARLGENKVQTMDQKARASEPLQVTTETTKDKAAPK